MGYLQTYLDMTDINIADYARENTTYSAFYFHWRDQLFARCMRLFEDVTDPVPPEEVEIRLFIQGHCGASIHPKDGELTAFFGLPTGVGKYRDRKPFYSVRCPNYSKVLPVYYGAKDKGVGKVVVIKNDHLMNPLYDLVHHYACILAHVEVTLIHTAVNARVPNGIPVAASEIQKNSFGEFFKKLFNGKFGFVTDLGQMGVETVGAHTNVTQGLEETWNVRERILASFLSDIGINTGINKRSNSVSDEINADTPSLLVNINDMLKAREEGFALVNERFGVNWSTKINKNLDYINMFTNPDVDFVGDKGADDGIQTL